MKFYKYIFGCILIFSACKKFTEIDPPHTELIRSAVFTNDNTANATMIDIYYQLSSNGFASGTQLGFSLISTYSSDEQINYFVGNSDYEEFNSNELKPSNNTILNLWSDLYKIIYKSNAIIEGVAGSTKISEQMKKQLEGESKFIRAFCSFYLVNLWGDIPLTTSTDSKLNAGMLRTPQEDVYKQIISDLKDAQRLLPDNYIHSNNERVRANRYAATALLSRAYLYTEDWANAEAEASKVIDHTTLYNLVTNLNLAFRANNTEAIWQFHSTARPQEWFTFRVLASIGPLTGAFRNSFVNNFETGDKRSTEWVRNVVYNGNLYYFPGKYKSSVAAEDYSTVIRLAEVFLIRAEARTRQNKLTGANSANSDINTIRNRAGLGNTSAVTQSQLLLAIEQERNVELFTEFGHRWFDLKRTKRAGDILSSVKGNKWQFTDVLYPIPEYEALRSRLEQNDGY